MENDRKEWLEWRRSGIGASDAPAVAGVSPFATRLDVFLDKTGRLPEKPPQERMTVGLALEPVIARLFEERTGESIQLTQVKLTSKTHPFMLATIDALTASVRVIEFKAAGLWTGQKLGDDGDYESLPEHWLIQAQHQMIVSQAKEVTFAVLHPALELRLYTVPANQSLQAALIDLESEFWSCVCRDEPPQEVCPQDAATLAQAFTGWDGFTTLTDRDAEAADSFVRIGAEIRELEKAREAARARLLLSLGDCREGSLPDGRIVSRKVIEIEEKRAREAGEVVRKASKQVRLFVKESQS